MNKLKIMRKKIRHCKCAVFGCNTESSDKITMYKFPNHLKEKDRFKAWVSACGSKDLFMQDPGKVSKLYICRKHFALPNDRLIKLSKTDLPKLELPESVQIPEGWMKMANNDVKDNNIQAINKEIKSEEQGIVHDTNSDTDEIEKLEKNLKLFCRICALECKDMHNIFDKSNQVILDMLTLSTDIKFIEIDFLPKQICNTCVKEVTACYEFRLKSKKSDEVLKELFFHVTNGNKEKYYTCKKNDEKITHPKENKQIDFKCKICGKVSKTFKKLQAHKTKYKNNACNVCPFCKKTVQYPLRRHLLTHEDVRPYKCLKCGKSYKKAANLKEHQNTHTGMKSFICKMCQKEFVTKRQLVIHSRIHTKLRPYLCSICGEKFAHLSTFVAHNRLHTGEKPYECLQCNKKFHTASARMLHIKRKKCGNTDEVEEKLNALCYICGDVYSSQLALQNHIIKHTGQIVHNCQMCDKGFAREDHLKSHLRTHTGERPFACPFCEKCFSQSGVLQTHLALHNGKTNSCDTCGKAFSRPSHLKRHKLIHLGVKKYQCKFCDKKFTQKAHLTTHENSHLADNPYKCPTCNMCFSQKVSLRKHMLTHTGERPYLCHLCGISYTQTGRLAAHMRKVHNNEKTLEIQDKPEESNLTLQPIFNQEEVDGVLENLSNQQSVDGSVLENQTFELVTQSGQRFLATSLVLLSNQFNVVSNNHFMA